MSRKIILEDDDPEPTLIMKCKRCNATYRHPEPSYDTARMHLLYGHQMDLVAVSDIFSSENFEVKVIG